jgi:peptidoglycan/LPS O-acetylase OafA/YrhL
MSTQSVSPANRKRGAEARIPGLDALRGMAAVGVVILHYHMYFDAGPNWVILYPAYKGAEFFVDLFFVLSGFLLTQVYAHITSYRELVVRRFARLFPLQWLALILVLVGQYFYTLAWGKPFIYRINDTYHFILNVFLLQQTGLQTGFSFNGPSWSISVEWIVNLVFFSVLLLPRLTLPAALFFAISSISLLAASQPNITNFGLSFNYIDTSLLRVFFGFFVGVIAAVSLRTKLITSTAPKTWDILAMLLGISFLLFLSIKSTNKIISLQIIAVGILMPLLVISCAKGLVAGRILSAKPLVWLGDISYAVYLIHFPVLLLIFGFRLHLPFNLNSAEGMLATLLIVLLVAHFVFHYFEKPTQRFLRRILSQNNNNPINATLTLRKEPD